MSDLISRQDAIEAVCKSCSMVGDYHKCDGYPESSTWCEEITALRSVPSALSAYGDLISRQSAIDGFYEMACSVDALCTVGDYVKFLENMTAYQAGDNIGGD